MTRLRSRHGLRKKGDCIRSSLRRQWRGMGCGPKAKGRTRTMAPGMVLVPPPETIEALSK